MIRLTAEAAMQIRAAARQSNLEGMPLRLAGSKNSDGSIHYGMGFDDFREGDAAFTSDHVELVVSAASIDLLDGMTVDFVEIEPGKPQFIFINPKDTNYTAPQ
ncbi:MAG: iron-sulfur cluster assembly protein [Pseudomonadota bacterium]|nr:iron-sulfur cluster assembly protein [Pseudomonadota bacterium]